MEHHPRYRRDIWGLVVRRLRYRRVIWGLVVRRLRCRRDIWGLAVRRLRCHPAINRGELLLARNLVGAEATKAEGYFRVTHR